jgi:hypothetical protein
MATTGVGKVLGLIERVGGRTDNVSGLLVLENGPTPVLLSVALTVKT